jgi:hypothetical protein
MILIVLIVISTREDLLAGRAEEEGVLELGNVGALDVHKGRVGCEHPQFHQVLQT